jgi:hypothetical protein
VWFQDILVFFRLRFPRLLVGFVPWQVCDVNRAIKTLSDACATIAGAAVAVLGGGAIVAAAVVVVVVVSAMITLRRLQKIAFFRNNKHTHLHARPVLQTQQQL